MKGNYFFDRRCFSVFKAVPAFSAAALVLLISGCSGADTAPDSTASPSATTELACLNVESGAVSESVSVEGDFGALPEVTFEVPLEAADTQRTVLIEGDGEATEAGQSLDIALGLYSASTGELVSSNGFDDTDTVSIAMDDTLYLPGLVRAAECLNVGSRVVLTDSVTGALGADLDPTSIGLTAEDTSVVIVIDVLGITQTAAAGEPQEAPEGFPLVTLDEDGAPTVTIPEELTEPTETQVGVLKLGDGEEVQAGDTVTLQYQGVNWRTGEVFDQSWTSGPTSFDISQTVTGFQTGLIGQKVNSQVIVVIPPADGYGEDGNTNAGIEGTDTIIFVIDILDTEHATSAEETPAE